MSDPQPDTTDTRSDTTDTRSDPTSNRDRTGTRDTLNPRVMQWVSGLAALVGLWLVASPFLFESTDTAVWNDTLVGTAIFALAGYNFVRMSRDRLAAVGVAALVILLGLWAAVSPYVIDMGSDTLLLSTVASGLIIAALSTFNAYLNNKADVAEQPRARS
ncbi:hypothetical protein BRD19_02270 [Halobacteriales archaeon SW_7_65_23]|nr:MAG: hypothetical protein BRD19_02270 [Halobacteriales archaeon SW_7_65_23]